MQSEVISLCQERNVTLTCYLQETGEGYGHLEKRPAVLIVPGGGYTHCSRRESDPVAFGFLKAGYQAFILNYTCLDKGSWPLPLQDYEEAMKLILSHKEQWKIDPDRLASIGFSAGGHLACAGALLTSYPPKALILGYSLLTDEIEKYAPGFPSLIEHVNDQTPPCFLFATANDASVSVKNTLQFAEKLAEHAVMFECHVYPYGRHGFSTGEDSVQKDPDPLYPAAADWVQDSLAFCRAAFDPKLKIPAFNQD
ncbi:MAG: alpha/beta hydrolase [Solobacterium sp.]|jgi:acetyl esterase/lipase|nr:alpha/beta hydrolase [Solobacterium sp.]MCH4205114.1 alpha/beta hydrolase [Solobacterium sp.]MCH4226707.1 alpha/beta hydrolase [Solobacterium sp.]MCH4281964.1 alpha/beta hydrolase [Solobacterium sp.]